MAETLFKSNKITLDSELLAKAVIKLIKQDIFERFEKTGTLSEDDQELCDKIDWYPVDELELKEEYVEKLRGIEKSSHSATSVEELDKLMNLK